MIREPLKFLRKKILTPADKMTKGSVIGVSVTSLTIYSHIDTVLSLSQSFRKILSLWREIIAFPWRAIADLIGFSIAKPTAGFLTVLIATILVVRSSWTESNERMTFSFRFAAVLVCSILGFLYSAYIVVPALYDASDPTFEVTSMAIEGLAAMYYTEVDSVEVIPLVKWATTFVVFAAYAILLSWPYWGAVSRKSRARIIVGATLSVVFSIFIADRIVYSFLPVNLHGDDLMGNLAVGVAIFAVLLGPYLSSVFLSDPLKSAKRGFSIATLLLLIFALDRIALCFEWATARIAG